MSGGASCRRREAGDLALVFGHGLGAAAALRVSGHLAPLQGPVQKDGPNVEIDTYSFLTTTPISLVATINHERMPVLLAREKEFDKWLRGSVDEAFALARVSAAKDVRHGEDTRMWEDFERGANRRARANAFSETMFALWKLDATPTSLGRLNAVVVGPPRLPPKLL